MRTAAHHHSERPDLHAAIDPVSLTVPMKPRHARLSANSSAPSTLVLELGACTSALSPVSRIRSSPTNPNMSWWRAIRFAFHTIHRNREINKCEFSCGNCAVSNERDATFYLHPVYIVGGTTQRESGRPVRVPARSLADLDARHGPFSALIVDIEGAELEIFGGSDREVLSRAQEVVIVEIHPWAIGESGAQKCPGNCSQPASVTKEPSGSPRHWQRD